MPSTNLEILVFGAPGDVGGAGTELWHTLRIWREQAGWKVRIVPTTPIAPHWRERCLQIGITVHEGSTSPADFLRTLQTMDSPQSSQSSAPTDIHDPDGAIETFLRQELPSIGSEIAIVAFCNDHFLRMAAALRKCGSRLVWANCMNWLFRREIAFCSEYGPFDHYVFQSLYQGRSLTPLLATLGVVPAQTSIIRGAFCADEFPFAPALHTPGEPFIVGRLSRADPAKYPVNFWRILRGVPYQPLRARVMGWSDQVARKIGRPPKWAEVTPPGTMDSATFLRSLHASLPLSGGAQENWPRVGLEAMASGTPVIAPNAWGWREMIEHERTGLLVDDETDTAYGIARLARDEPFRLKLVRQARDEVVHRYANPQPLLDAWYRAFTGAAPKIRT